MPSHTCYVPGCRTGYFTTCQIKARGKEPPSLFRPPVGLLQKWNSIIQRLDRPMHRQDVVCSLHFREEDIERYYEHTINGKVISMKRGTPRLKVGSLPCISLNKNQERRKGRNRSTSVEEEFTPQLFQHSIKKVKKHKNPEVNIKKNKNIKKNIKKMYKENNSTRQNNSDAISKISIKGEDDSDICIIDDDSKEETDGITTCTNDELYQLLKEHNKLVLMDNTSYSSEVEQLDRKLLTEDSSQLSISTTLNVYEDSARKSQFDSFTYEKLLLLIYEIKLPNTLWSAHKHPKNKYIAFIHVTLHPSTGIKIDRGVVFKGTLKPVIYFHGHKVSVETLCKEVISLSELTDLLLDMESFQVSIVQVDEDQCK